MEEREINKIFERISNLNVLIIGDVMVDTYLWGEVERISPEAPVPVVSVESKEQRLGGAANVAVNTRSMMARPMICAVIGADETGRVFQDLLKAQNMTTEGLVLSEERVTSEKTRVISGSQQMIRVDEESVEDILKTEEKALLGKVKGLLEAQRIDVVIFEDYNKGTLTPSVIRTVIQWAREQGVPTVVDPKKRNFLMYQGVTLFKPNLKELLEGVNAPAEEITEDSLKKAIEEVRKNLKQDLSLVTLSEKGVFIDSDEGYAIYPSHVRDISDVSGAGDTVVTVAALALSMELSPPDIARLANLAGGLVCEKVGVVPVDKNRLLEEIVALYRKE